MTHPFRNTAVLMLLLPLIATMPVAAQRTKPPVAAQRTKPPAALTMQATGSFEGGTFTGTVTINRFEARGNEIVAIGFVRGVLRQGGQTLGTVAVGERAFPVRVSSGGVVGARNDTPTSTARPRRISTLVPVQAETCPVVQIALGPFDVNVLGVLVSLDPIVLDLVGDPSAPLGALVCEVSELLGNVVALVGVLNDILGLLTGLLGGLTGGL